MKPTAKKHIIERLIDVPDSNKRPFWAREMTLLNRLIERWPNLDFWHKVKFREKFPSLAYLLTDIGINNVKRKYNEFNFEIKPLPTYNLGDKIGEDRQINKTNKSLRNFLNNEQP